MKRHRPGCDAIPEAYDRAYSHCNCPEETTYHVGDTVRKMGGDYRFDGIVVAAFVKVSGKARYVVENADGILHIFSETQLEKRP